VCLGHDMADRLVEIAAPTLVLSGELDIILPPRVGRSVAAAIPNARVDAFWRQIE
jgi:pimeloyl-ACP methyl ester carboxylesterase